LGEKISSLNTDVNAEILADEYYWRRWWHQRMGQTWNLYLSAI